MKNFKIKAGLIVLTALLVTSCDLFGGFFGRKSYEKVAKNTNYSNRALDETLEMSVLDSLGNQKMLVVPVVFTDTTALATAQNHAMLERVFFGDSEETGWESVASYYEKSSYGRLKLSGEVMPYFNLGYSTSTLDNYEIDEYQEIGEGYYWDQTHYVIEDIYNTYGADKFKEYDLDNDGFVDAFWIVYMAEINATGADEDVFWAYKFYWNREPDTAKPTPNSYAWASFRFAMDGVGYTRAKPDAHTFIHETGHLLGLPDYYDYDFSVQTGTQATNPTGGLDMMAYNVGDHNPYSKYRYNWLEPYVFQGDVDIPLAPFASSGDTILLKNGWNGHAYDEYILIDYYTPTELNAKDSEGRGYVTGGTSNVGTLNFTMAGVRIWHVDSRLLRYTYNNDGDLVSRTWTNEIYGDYYTYTDVGPSNTSSYSQAPIGELGASENKLLHLMDAKGRTSTTGNWLRSSAVASSDALFQTGMIIEANEWGAYLQTANGAPVFNDGTPVGYSVEIGEMSEEQVIIKIRRAIV